MSALRPILLKKSICQSVTKFPSNPLALLGILIQISTPRDSIVSAQRNKIQRADFSTEIAQNRSFANTWYLPESGHDAILWHGFQPTALDLDFNNHNVRFQIKG